MTGQEDIREITDDLDAAGNTTAAIGKGFAIGSAALVSLALFGAFVTTVGLADEGVDILQPKQFAGLLIGAMLPYWFSAMTMKSVGMAAQEMNNEVRRQFAENPRLLTHPEEETPDYNECIRISTESSLKEMVPPGVLVMGTPIIVGFLFGREALAGILAGQLVSGVQIAISASNTGGAWDNAKKHIESGQMGDENRKGPIHDAAVVGDTVGDPLKDTSGPALNILVKLSAIISLVLAPAILQTGKDGEGLLSRWGVL
jgi:inorganic pyrophosphatase